MGERPVALAGVAGLMCCSPEEAEAIEAVLAASFGGCVMDGFDEEEEEEGGEGSGAVARVDDAGRVKVRLAPESRRRAGKYVAFVLDQLEGIACGEDVGGDEEGGGGGGGDAAAGGGRGGGTRSRRAAAARARARRSRKRAQTSTTRRCFERGSGSTRPSRERSRRTESEAASARGGAAAAGRNETTKNGWRVKTRN